MAVPCPGTAYPLLLHGSRTGSRHVLPGPSATLFRRASKDADIIHIYEPFSFGRHARDYARPTYPRNCGFHIQPENIMYSLGACRLSRGFPQPIYRPEPLLLQKDTAHTCTYTDGRDFLQRSHYRNALHRHLQRLLAGFQPWIWCWGQYRGRRGYRYRYGIRSRICPIPLRKGIRYCCCRKAEP